MVFLDTRLIQVAALCVALPVASSDNSISGLREVDHEEEVVPNEVEEVVVTPNVPHVEPMFLDKKEIELGSLTAGPLPEFYYHIVDAGIKEIFNPIMHGLVHKATFRMNKNKAEEDDGEVKKWMMTIETQDLDSFMKESNQYAYFSWKQMSDGTHSEPLGVVDENKFNMMVASYAKEHNLPSLKITFTPEARGKMIRFLNVLADQSIGMGQMAKMTLGDDERHRELILLKKEEESTIDNIIGIFFPQEPTTLDTILGIIFLPIQIILFPFLLFLNILGSVFSVLCVIFTLLLNTSVINVAFKCGLLDDITSILFDAGEMNGWNMDFLLTDEFQLEGVENVNPEWTLVTAAGMQAFADTLGYGDAPAQAVEMVADFTNNLVVLLLELVLRGAVDGINTILAGLLPQPFLGLAQTVTNSGQTYGLQLISLLEEGA